MIYYRTFPVLFLLIGFTLGSCGFSPMYGNVNTSPGNKVVENQMARIDIARIPEREGQILRNTLVERLHGGGDSTVRTTYSLKVEPINEKRTELDITETSDTTRAQLKLSTTISLKHAGKGKTALQRDIQAVTSYNVLASQFTTRVSRQNARENAIRTLADRIERQLALYFKRTSKTESDT